MKVVINAVLSYEQPRGVGRYLNVLIPAIAEIDKENEYHIYYGKWMKQYDFLKLNQKNFHFIELNISNNQILRNLYLAFVLPFKFKKLKPNLYFLADTQASFVKTCKTVSTIHDLMEFEFPEKYSKAQRFLRKWIVKIQVKLSDCIITVSNYSKNDLCTLLHVPEKKVVMIPNAVNKSSYVSEPMQPKNYFLFVSETESAKNAKVLILAFSLLSESIKKNFELKIVGKKGNQQSELENIIKVKNLENRVTFYGYVSDDELRMMYAEAYAFVFPSLFEGFGLPVAEAMANSVPVLCSNAASIPEVGGDAVLTFEPHNENELCALMESIIINPELRTEMIAKGLKRVKLFTNEAQAKRTKELFERLVK